jgi:hypothetical protein
MIAADQKYGAWRVLAIKGHAVTCLCRCHTVRFSAWTEFWTAPAARSCGCSPSSEEVEAMRAHEAFEERRRELRKMEALT